MPNKKHKPCVCDDCIKKFDKNKLKFKQHDSDIKELNIKLEDVRKTVSDMQWKDKKTVCGGPKKNKKKKSRISIKDVMNVVLKVAKKVDTLSEDMEIMKSDISGLKKDVSGLKQDVSGLKKDVSGLKKDVSGLKKDVSGLKKDVGNLEDQVKHLNKKVFNEK